MTRGVPGTHDVELGIRVLSQLGNAEPTTTTLIPRFDKATDDPRPLSQWERFTGRADLILFEGWCVGAIAQPEAELVAPVNSLECEFDSNGTWRNYVNQQLAGRYRELFGLIDILTLLRAPGFERTSPRGAISRRPSSQLAQPRKPADPDFTS